MGLARPPIRIGAGELLPRHFTLARRSFSVGGRYVSVALSVGSPLLGVTQHPARWSSDFPPSRSLGVGGVYPPKLQRRRAVTRFT